MKYTKLIIGLLFFSNPYFGPIDYLPDFIGLLLIADSIKAIAEVSPSAEAAIASFKKAAIVSGAQIAVYIPLLSTINSEPSFNLLYSAAFAVLRLIFLIPAFNELFNSLIFFSERSASKHGYLRRTRISVMTFTIFHCIFSALPEIVYIRVYMVPSGNEIGYTSYFPLAHYRTGVMVLCAFIVLIVGILWFIFTTSKVNRLKKDRSFNATIFDDLSHAEHSVKKTVLKSLKPAIFLLSVASFTSFTYFVDGRPLIPPYFAPIFHVIAIGYMRNMCLKKVTRSFSIAASFFGLLMHLGCELFAFRSHEIALFAFEDVKKQFMLPLILGAVYTVFMILSLISVCRALCILINEHTGLFWENAFTTHNAKVGKDKLRQLFNARMFTLLFSAAIIFCLVSYSFIYVKPILNLISTAVILVLAFAFTTLLSSIKASVTEKYTTENKMN